jgi:TolB-like protein/DNA-binding winged helix-turn-helix (wHTH) protein/Flp pilus assembly protein TadD
MAAASPIQRAFRFGPFEADAQTGELRKNGLKIRLQEKPFQVLIALVERPGQVVSREELQRRLWPADTFVDFNNSLNTAITRLRETLGDSAEEHRYVETLARRGYRFVGQVEEISTPSKTGSKGVVAPPRPRLWRWLIQGKSLALICISATVAVAVLGYFRLRETKPTGRVMLAVLPFENLSGDPNQEYLSDGFTEEMITELARLQPERLGVIARTSAMQYKNTKKSTDRIGHELGVQYLLEGSALSSGNRLRITAQLIRVQDQTHVWADSYERELGDVLALQDEVARSVAREIRAKLSPENDKRLSSPRHVDPETYQAFLKGRYHLNKRTGADIQQAIQYFQQSIARDPRYAAAYAGLADATYAAQYRMIAPQEVVSQARDAANKALELDDTLPEAHVSLAWIELAYDRDWMRAEMHLKRALELSPGYADAHYVYGFAYLLPLGKFEDAVQEMKWALELDPLSLIINANLGGTYFEMRRYDLAVEQCQKTLEIDTQFGPAHSNLGLAYEQKGMYEEAISEFRAAFALHIGTQPLAQLGHAYALSGRRVEALNVLDQLKELSRHTFVSPFDFATVYVGLGENDQAIASLDEAIKAHVFPVIFLKVDQRFDPLHSHHRYGDLLRRLDLDQ